MSWKRLCNLALFLVLGKISIHSLPLVFQSEYGLILWHFLWLVYWLPCKCHIISFLLNQGALNYFCLEILESLLCCLIESLVFFISCPLWLGWLWIQILKQPLSIRKRNAAKWEALWYWYTHYYYYYDYDYYYLEVDINYKELKTAIDLHLNKKKKLREPGLMSWARNEFCCPR